METTARQPNKDNNQRRMQVREDVMLWLSGRPNQMATKEAFRQEFGGEIDFDEILADDWFVSFDYQGNRWVQPREYHESTFQKKLAKEKRKKDDDSWQKLMPLAGNVMRPDGTHGKSGRLYVIARTYTPESAAKRLGIPVSAVRSATANGELPSFRDPDGKVRIPAEAVENAAENEELLVKLTGAARVKLRDLAIVAGLPIALLRSRLRRQHISTTDPMWYEVRGQWGLPESLDEFNDILEERYPLWLEAVMGEGGGRNGRGRGALRERPTHLIEDTRSREQVRAEVNKLRQQLIDAFPVWDRDRSDQHITLHMGPTNSGKTFSGLNNLALAGSGWYLSPLRLLAHEVYETLNKRGVPCNLLTGEETINVEGATITAATIEMFNPRRSGACIIIDEAHMLADDQRGWAWTRAIMESTAPEMHIVGSPVSEKLVTRLAEELGFTISTERYERLTPLHVAQRPWSLEDFPPRTILVAFSRRTVLGLKADLEKIYGRSVAVVYGNLPPEVRLRQAERFATGEAEICVATDAIGMGLNLPADNVCFYEVEKFDGKNIRTLNPNEIKQIAGRAGRFGLSELGMVGSLSKANLEVIRAAIEAENTDIGFAYIAPTPESLALLPGTLDNKLSQWATLRAIPERWRKLLRTVDLSEQIKLAGMLSPDDVKRLGEETALHLISAPVANNTETYWYECARAIIDRRDMPFPDGDLPRKITDSDGLESYELMIRCADIYLWLAQRHEFARYAPEEENVRAERRRLSLILDDALAEKIDTARRCRSCGRPLPPNSRYNICERCFRERRFETSSFRGGNNRRHHHR